jgi:hypothetical protein
MCSSRPSHVHVTRGSLFLLSIFPELGGPYSYQRKWNVPKVTLCEFWDIKTHTVWPAPLSGQTFGALATPARTAASMPSCWRHRDRGILGAQLFQLPGSPWSRYRAWKWESFWMIPVLIVDLERTRNPEWDLLHWAPAIPRLWETKWYWHFMPLVFPMGKDNWKRSHL